MCHIYWNFIKCFYKYSNALVSHSIHSFIVKQFDKHLSVTNNETSQTLTATVANDVRRNINVVRMFA